MSIFPSTIEYEIPIPAGNAVIVGSLEIPPAALGIVVLAHGTCCGRFSQANRTIARILNKSGFATLFLDLLTPREDLVDQKEPHPRLDMRRLSARLQDATHWLKQHSPPINLPIGYFAADTAAAAALIAAAEQPDLVKAVVAQAGRPDLAQDILVKVRAPTLFLVGRKDDVALELHDRALTQLGSEIKVLKIIPGSSHLLEKPEKIDQVADLAASWFQMHLCPDRAPLSISRTDLVVKLVSNVA